MAVAMVGAAAAGLIERVRALASMYSALIIPHARSAWLLRSSGVSDKRTQHFTEGCMLRQGRQGFAHGCIIAMPLEVQIEDIFPNPLPRGTRFQFEQVDIIGREEAQAFIERAWLVRGSHDH